MSLILPQIGILSRIVPLALVGSAVTAEIPKGTGSTTVSFPSGCKEGDYVVIAIGRDQANQPGVPGFGLLDSDSTNPYTFVYGNRLSSGETSVDVQQVSNGDSIGACIVFAFEGISLISATDGVSVSATGATGAPNPPSYTTNVDGCVRIIVGVVDDDLVEGTVTAPSGYTLLGAKEVGVAGAGCTIMAAYKIDTTAGSEDPAVFGSAGNDAWNAFHFALRPQT